MGWRFGEVGKRTLDTQEAGELIGVFTILGHPIIISHDDAFSDLFTELWLKQRATMKDNKYNFTFQTCVYVFL